MAPARQQRVDGGQPAAGAATLAATLADGVPGGAAMNAETVFRGNLVHAMALDDRLCPLVRSQLYGMAVRMKLGFAFCEPVARRSPAVEMRLAQLRDAELARSQRRQLYGK